MKAIAHFILLLLLMCGSTLAWKSPEKGFRSFAVAEDGGRQKEAGDFLKSALQGVGLRMRSDASWSRADFQAKLETAFHRNDPCAVVDLLRSGKNVAARDFWSAGMAVLLSQHREQEALLEELLANSESPIFGRPKENSQRLETRFFNALVYSGQLQGVEDGDNSSNRRGLRNPEKAIEIFKELVREDPENGAHSYFLAGAFKKAGGRKDDVHAALNQAVKAARFDPFYQTLFDKLQSIAYQNAAMFTFVHAFLETMPMPDYELNIRYLKYWARSEEAGKWIALRTAKRLVELGARYKASSPGFQFSRSEYLLGHNLKYSVEGLMDRSWEDYSTKMREAQDFISQTPRAVEDAEVSLYRERIGSKQSCAPDAWKALYAAYRAKDPA